MKTILYTIALLCILGLNGCSDKLDTEPTDKVSGTIVFKSTTSAESSINGIYRMLYIAGWSTNWGSENCGQTAINLLADLMGEDHLMLSQGSGWFFEDYRLNVHSDFAGKDGRSYSIWNFYYTIICNANYIIASESQMEGDPELKQSIIGQAYAIRSFAYSYLIQLYQQTYLGHENAPGVPLYTEPTIAGTLGKTRGTVQQVYDQIMQDINKSITLLGGLKNKVQKHASHIDYYVANGIKARACLVQHHYKEAMEAAAEALNKPGLKIASVKELGGNNSTKVSDVLWGVEIIKDQTSGNASFFSHMDSDVPGSYGSKAQHCISTGLYSLISDSDERKSAWFRGKLAEEGKNSNVSYCQLKFKMADYSTKTGDYILMRAEEMLLIQAEALCQLEKYTEAREAIKKLGTMRDSKFEERLALRSDSKNYNSNTNAPLQTLMDEILFQRRLELWGEAGRIFDLQRLGLGYSRVYSNSNHTQKVSTKNTNAASPLFILPLPQSEIDGNENITDKDQNPIIH